MVAGFEAALPGDIEDALGEIEMVGAGSSGGGLHGNSRERTSRGTVWPIIRANAIGQIPSASENYGLTYFFPQ